MPGISRHISRSRVALFKYRCVLCLFRILFLLFIIFFLFLTLFDCWEEDDKKEETFKNSAQSLLCVLVVVRNVEIFAQTSRSHRGDGRRREICWMIHATRLTSRVEHLNNQCIVFWMRDLLGGFPLWKQWLDFLHHQRRPEQQNRPPVRQTDNDD